MLTPGDDELTGLRGRRSFLQLLGRQVLVACDTRTSLALVLVDIDGFAQINAVHGYAVGDELLKYVAQQLSAVARKQDYIGRVGEDRFALLLTNMFNPGHAELAVQKLLRLLEAPAQTASGRLRAPVSVGLALCPLHASHAEYLMRRAETALLRARRTGARIGIAPDTSSDLDISDLWDMEIQLAGAIERGEMELFYQPKVSARDGAVVGAEALMRWRSPTRGMVSPAVFIPIAERIGEIRRLTLWALNTALRQAAQWPDDVRKVAVNLPGMLATEDDLPDLVDSALKIWSGSGTELILEITEGSIVDAARAFPILARLRSLGVRISIDDFGTGYSCLSYFKSLPADELKIDRSFVAPLPHDDDSADLVRIIVAIGRRFGLSIAAEGIESTESAECLRALGCDVFQGYFFGKPMPAAAFAAWCVRADGAATGMHAEASVPS